MSRPCDLSAIDIQDRISVSETDILILYLSMATQDDAWWWATRPTSGNPAASPKINNSWCLIPSYWSVYYGLTFSQLSGRASACHRNVCPGILRLYVELWGGISSGTLESCLTNDLIMAFSCIRESFNDCLYFSFPRLPIMLPICEFTALYMDVLDIGKPDPLVK